MEQQSLNFKTWLDEYFKPAVENFYSEEKIPFRMTVQLIIQELREVYTQIHVWLLSNLLTQHPFCSSKSNFSFKLRIYFFAALGLHCSADFSPVGVSGGCRLSVAQASHCSERGPLSVCGAGSSSRWPPLWGSGSWHMGVGSCGSPALAHGVSSGGAQA